MALSTLHKPKLPPCYKFVSLVQENVVRLMDENDIIQGAFASPNFRVVAARARPKLSLVWLVERQIFEKYDLDNDLEIRETFDKPPPTIVFSLYKPMDKCRIRFSWIEQKDQVDRFLEGKPRVRLSKDLWTAAVGRNIVIYNSNPIYSKLADYRFILDMIFGTFIVEHFGIGRNCVNYIIPTEIMYPLAHRYRNSVQHINIRQPTEPNECTDLTSDELSALLDNLKAGEMTMDVKVAPGVKYTGILKTKRMRFNIAPTWLTLDNILTMECEKLIAYDVNFTVQDLTAIVRNWLGGGLEKLKRLNFINHGNKLSWSPVLDEFEGTAVQGEDNSWKEIRRGDGKVAHVVAKFDAFALLVYK